MRDMIKITLLITGIVCMLMWMFSDMTNLSLLIIAYGNIGLGTLDWGLKN